MEENKEFSFSSDCESFLVNNKYRRPKALVDSDDSDHENEDKTESDTEVSVSPFEDSTVNDSFEEGEHPYVKTEKTEVAETEINHKTHDINCSTGYRAMNDKHLSNEQNESDQNLTDEEDGYFEQDEDIINSSGEIRDEENSYENNLFKGSEKILCSTKSNISDDSDVEAVADSLNVIELSSEDENAAIAPIHQMQSVPNGVMSNILQKEAPLQVGVEEIKVKKSDYDAQVQKISNIEKELMRARNAKRVIKLENLPDKGQSLIQKEASLEKMLQEQKVLLNKMAVKDEAPVSVQNKIEIKWDEIEAGVDAVGPRTFGKKGVARFNAEKVMALETLDELHKSLATCPTENDSVEDPSGLKIPLMPHQRRALAWLLWRENQKPSGGLLADDMGLGKTLTMISLVIKSLQLESNLDQDKENYRDKYPGGTLVVCPASLINQWSGEIERRTKRGLLSFEVHHGSKREVKPKRLAKHDVVITTYAIVLNENEKNGTLFGVRWRRIILDEAHQIRNHKARTSEAVFRLSGKSRWALTGTPVHNKELDMYSQLKFLRCAPFDDLQVWKHWVSDKSTGGQMRLQAVISSLMLRRTKEELMVKGILQSLPERNWELVAVTLDKDEMDVYQKVLIFSRTLFAQFLHQRAEKRQDAIDLKFNDAPPDPNGEYFKMRNRLLKLNKVKEVSQHHILVLLLRLRQICCHPFLINQMLQGDEDLGDGDDEGESLELNLLDQLNRLDINDGEDEVQGLSEAPVGLKEASKGYLNPSNPVFMSERPSSKVKALVKLLKEKISTGDKAIIVSQWTSLLHLIGIQLKQQKVIYDNLDGTIPVNKRMPIVDNFNDPKSDTKVLLLSLTAGGVGLNLIGANHLFLMDLHWNPQLENQAQDRIYRMGQTKPIFVYKLMAADTIEERIKALQEKKLDIANSMLTGSKKVINSKLTLQDLKLLFDFK